MYNLLTYFQCPGGWWTLFFLPAVCWNSISPSPFDYTFPLLFVDIVFSFRTRSWNIESNFPIFLWNKVYWFGTKSHSVFSWWWWCLSRFCFIRNFILKILSFDMGFVVMGNIRAYTSLFLMLFFICIGPIIQFIWLFPCSHFRFWCWNINFS